MSMQHRLARTTCAALVLLAASGVASATSVSAGGSLSVGTLTDLGWFAAGTYELTGSGVVDLVGDSTSFLINPDGTPFAPVTSPGYGYFNPNGSYLADWFLIGYADTVTLAADGHIYASVNDTYHDNDLGAFNVDVTAVPEPASIGLILGALAMFATQRRRRD